MIVMHPGGPHGGTGIIIGTFIRINKQRSTTKRKKTIEQQSCKVTSYTEVQDLFFLMFPIELGDKQGIFLEKLFFRDPLVMNMSKPFILNQILLLLPNPYEHNQ